MDVLRRIWDRFGVGLERVEVVLIEFVSMEEEGRD